MGNNKWKPVENQEIIEPSEREYRLTLPDHLRESLPAGDRVQWVREKETGHLGLSNNPQIGEKSGYKWLNDSTCQQYRVNVPTKLVDSGVLDGGDTVHFIREEQATEDDNEIYYLLTTAEAAEIDLDKWDNSLESIQYLFKENIINPLEIPILVEEGWPTFEQTKEMGLGDIISSLALESLNALGKLAYRSGNYDKAYDYLHESLILSRTLEDRDAEAESLNTLGLVALENEDFSASRGYFQTVIAIRDQMIRNSISDRKGKAHSIDNLGLAFSFDREDDRAEDLHRESLAIKREIDDERGEANSLGNLGLVLRHQGNYSEARQKHKESLQLKKDLDDRQGIATSYTNLGRVEEEDGNPKQARDYFEDALDEWRDLDHDLNQARNLHKLGDLDLEQDELESAATRFTEAAEKYRDVEHSNLFDVYEQLITTYEQMAKGDETGAIEEGIEICAKALNDLENLELPTFDDSDFEEKRELFLTSRERLRKKNG